MCVFSLSMEVGPGCSVPPPVGSKGRGPTGKHRQPLWGWGAGGELAWDTPPCVDPTVRLVPNTSGPLGNLGARGRAQE